MNIMQLYSAPQMLRTHPAHSGTVKLTNIMPGAQIEQEQTSSIKPGSFQSYLINALNSVNNQQLEFGRVQEQLITEPESLDIHDVTTAMAKAQLSLSLAQTVIDRLVQGWSEIQVSR